MIPIYGYSGEPVLQDCVPSSSVPDRTLPRAHHRHGWHGAMNKPPAFQFYPKDWLSSRKVLMMNLEQEGAYIRLLCYCWDSGDCSLPGDEQELALMSRLGEGWFKGGSAILLKCFVPHPEKDGFLTNQRLYDELVKQREWKQKSSEGGKKSAEKRKESKGGSRVVQPKANRPVEPKGNSSSASSSSNPPSVEAARFDEWYGNYPRKVARKDAVPVYMKALKLTTAEVLIQKAKEFSGYCSRESTPLKLIPYPSTWLNDQRWKNDYSAGKKLGGMGSFRP